MRRWAVLAGVLLALAGCGGDPAQSAAPATPSSAAPDDVFTTTMDSTAPNWRQDFAVEGVDTTQSPQLAILAAETACNRLISMPVDKVLLSFLGGELPPETIGSLVYAATVAYCPKYTDVVQAYADAHRQPGG